MTRYFLHWCNLCNHARGSYVFLYLMYHLTNFITNRWSSINEISNESVYIICSISVNKCIYTWRSQYYIFMFYFIWVHSFKEYFNSMMATSDIWSDETGGNPRSSAGGWAWLELTAITLVGDEISIRGGNKHSVKFVTMWNCACSVVLVLLYVCLWRHIQWGFTVPNMLNRP